MADNGERILEDAKDVWIELHRLVQTGDARGAIMADWSAGSLAAKFIDRVRQWKRESQKRGGT